MLNTPGAYIVSFEEVVIRTVVVVASCPVSALIEAEKRKNVDQAVTTIKQIKQIDVSSIEEVISYEEAA